ncbi:GGDEF domain-containing protein [Rhodobacterales bacterium]|nr:GGDEF domain-containing protein [Rhodobacterales bacterium]
MELILSVPATLLCLSLVYVFFLIVISCALQTSPGATHLKFWALSFWSPALGGILIVLRPYFPLWMSDYLGCLLFLTGLACAWLGTRTFFGRPAPVLFPLLVIFGLLPTGIVLDTSFERMALVRQLYIFSAAGVFFALAAAECGRGKKGERLPSAWAGVLVFGSFSLVHFGALPFPVFDPIDLTTSMPISRWLFVMVVLSLLHTVAVAFVCLVLAKERVEIRVQHLANTDALTGLWNRRAFVDLVQSHLQTTDAAGTLMVFDLDRFKRINDRHGHLVGDRVLQAFAGFLLALEGPRVICGRIGGEEFAVYVMGRQGPDMDRLARKVCLGVSILKVPGKDGRIFFTTSVGLSDTSTSGRVFDSLYDAADHALYLAKRRGRNRSHRRDADALLVAAPPRIIDAGARLSA